MPAGSTVRPNKWRNVIDLYDDGHYSTIWGSYDGSENKCLGVRWNGSDQSHGYPNYMSNPLWYVEPHFITRNILLELISKVNNNPSFGNLQNILQALKECS